MSFDWSKYLYLAQELAGQPTSPSGEEARLRSAISRAYYAAFCKARNYLRDEEKLLVPPGGEAHRYVRDVFRTSSDSLYRRIGHNLARLRIDRNRADYEDFVVGLSSITVIDLKLAKEVISDLSTLRENV
ncbi:MAG: hypothetical protein ACUVV0_03445 [Anaerolineae bacterium]